VPIAVSASTYQWRRFGNGFKRTILRVNHCIERSINCYLVNFFFSLCGWRYQAPKKFLDAGFFIDRSNSFPTENLDHHCKENSHSIQFGFTCHVEWILCNCLPHVSTLLTSRTVRSDAWRNWTVVLRLINLAILLSQNLFCFSVQI
jgi:hypothetical protein